jgi:NADPH:quinone reductase
MATEQESMIEAQVSADTTVTLHRVPIPQISEPADVLIKVVVAGCNPKDWKMPAGRKCASFRAAEELS